MICKGISEAGSLRADNEDSYAIKRIGDALLMVIADGIGGIKGGEVASMTAVDSVMNNFPDDPENYDEEGLRTLFEKLFDRANRDILIKSYSDSDLAGMGTTLTISLVYGKKVFIAHIGDTRAYLVHGSSIIRLTEDHTAGDAMGVNRNCLTRSLGENEFIKPDFYVYNIIYGDMILLTTDGLHGYLTDSEILKCLKMRNDIDGCLIRLTEEAYRAGSTDNVTALLSYIKPDAEDVDKGENIG
ncbi:MAG: serine/threonine-protein phosphatase [Clostridiales bacterium]|nr:serine/threonine-protein phosphatase [Clostridiales bacterium]MBR6484360.1 serine/threonine-protein phosphatase [Clostridiales bacterium]